MMSQENVLRFVHKLRIRSKDLAEGLKVTGEGEGEGQHTGNRGGE